MFGDIVRLVLTPPTTTLEVGQARTLTTVAHHAGGGTESVTQQVVYTSSDPTVVVVEAMPAFDTTVLSVVDINGGHALAGDVLRYTLRVVNSGTVLANDARAELPLPAYTAYAPGSTRLNGVMSQQFAGLATSPVPVRCRSTSTRLPIRQPAQGRRRRAASTRSRRAPSASGARPGLRPHLDHTGDAALTVKTLAALTLPGDLCSRLAVVFLTTVGEVTGADSSISPRTSTCRAPDVVRAMTSRATSGSSPSLPVSRRSRRFAPAPIRRRPTATVTVTVSP